MPTNIWTPKEDRESLPPTYLVVSVGGAPRDSNNCQKVICKILDCYHELFSHLKCQRVSLARQTLREGSPYHQESISLMKLYSHLDRCFRRLASDPLLTPWPGTLRGGPPTEDAFINYSHLRPGRPFTRGPPTRVLSSRVTTLYHKKVTHYSHPGQVPFARDAFNDSSHLRPDYPK